MQMANRLNITSHQGNTNQSHSDIYVYQSEWLSSKRTQTTNVVEDVEKREPSYIVGENVNWCSHCEKQYGGFSKN